MLGALFKNIYLFLSVWVYSDRRVAGYDGAEFYVLSATFPMNARFFCEALGCAVVHQRKVRVAGTCCVLNAWARAPRRLWRGETCDRSSPPWGCLSQRKDAMPVPVSFREETFRTARRSRLRDDICSRNVFTAADWGSWITKHDYTSTYVSWRVGVTHLLVEGETGCH